MGVLPLVDALVYRHVIHLEDASDQVHRYRERLVSSGAWRIDLVAFNPCP